MSFINLSYNVVIYEDQDPKNPRIRQPDVAQQIQQVCVSSEATNKFVINPNEIQILATTQRPVSWSGSTQLEFDRYISTLDNVRIIYTGTGTNPVFRVNREIDGGADTEVSMTRLSAYVMRVKNEAGTAWDTTLVQNGDILKIEKDTDSFTSPFDSPYKGKSYMVQAKGSDYIDIVDNGELPATTTNITLGADFEFALRVFSNSPVKVGDSIEISGAGIHPSNQGKYTIVDLSYDYIEVINPYSVEETVLYGTNSLVVYDRLIGFVMARSSAPFKIRFGESEDWTFVDRIGPEALFIGSIRTYGIQATCDGPDAVDLTISHATVV